MERYFTLEEAAKLLRISRSTMYRLLKSGKLRTVRLGERRRLVPESAVEELVRQEEGREHSASAE